MDKTNNDEQKPLRIETSIPENMYPSRLIYNASTNTIILEAMSNGNGDYVHLFVRRSSDNKYIKLGNPDEGLSYRSTFSSFSQPYIYFQSLISERLKWGGGRETWQSFNKADLRNYNVEKLITKDEIIYPEPYICGLPYCLINVSDDGNYFYCGIGFKKPESEDYSETFLCKLDIKTKRIEIISELKGVWF